MAKLYSYKGGVGRSMALANVAALLAKWGHRVLVVDWDLEAPGLEKFFERASTGLQGQRARKKGMVDLICGWKEGKEIPWKECLLAAKPFPGDGEMALISADTLSAQKGRDKEAEMFRDRARAIRGRYSPKAAKD